MTKPNDKPPTNGPKGKKQPDKDQKKPRGMGGVFIIMLLLLALLLVVGRGSDPSKGTNYDFLYRLYNGDFTRIVVAGSDGQVTGEYEDRSTGERRKLTTVFKEITPETLRTMRELQGRPIDRHSYERSGMQAFLEDLRNQQTVVSKAWIINQTKPRTAQTARRKQRSEPRPATTYLTAIAIKGGEEHYFYVPADPDASGGTLRDVVTQLRKQNVQPTHIAISPSDSFEIERIDTLTYYLIGTLGPWILIIGLFWFFIIRQMRSPGGAGGVLSFGRSRASRYNKEQKTHVTFDDVEGMDEAKDEVREVIEFLKNRQKFQRLGGRIPRGVLLVGPPGTGKTLLAKAIAGEADVPFFSISGSDFVEMFVGVGASRVRDLFKQARESAPCIIFLDEIDAVGRKRGTGMGGGHDEREQTLNAILVEMDGFDTDEGTILIGATNRPDVLDPALLRPGRFDRQVVIDMPDVTGREAILKVHARKVKCAPNLDYARLARATPGFSGAELAALINEGAILAGMAGDAQVELRHLEEARDRVRWGREKRSRRMEDEDRRVTAYHEAGHALVGARIPEVDPVHKVTIIARGRALGATMYLPEKDDYHMRRSKLVGMIAMSYGGRVAEQIVFNDISAGAQNDIAQATRIARMMVAEWGMSDAVGPLNYAATPENNFLGHDFHFGHEHSEETSKLIDAEVKKLIDEGYARATKILTEDRAILDSITKALMRWETITGEEVRKLVDGTPLDELRPDREEPTISEEPAVEPPARAPSPKPEDDIDLSGAEGFVTP